MELTLIGQVALRELREALRNRWVLAYTIGFAVLAVGLSKASLASAGYAGLGGFGRTAASLVNALLLFVPLLGLTVGASTLAGDRERGTLFYLLAQPVSRGEVFFGKTLGAALGTIASLAAGFGFAALALNRAVGDHPQAFLGLAGYTLLLGVSSLGLGLLISSLSRKASTAMGAALLAWLGLAFFSDLALMTGVQTLHPSPARLLAMLVINPLQLFKLGAIYSLQASLDTLGPAGQYALYRFGNSLPYLLAGLLAAWSGLTLGAAFGIFSRRQDF